MGSVSASTASNHVVGSIPDPEGDDDGPGGYAYPTASEFVDGAYDMTGVTIYDNGDSWTFEVGIAGDFTNSYEFAGGFGVQVLELYIRDPDAGSDVPTSTQGRPGTGVTFEGPWHYLV
ncbi:glucodextranase DOMON-like domain-containing protein, partial [Halapricum sp. CBA1109]|uniref:glucodextranase DOMON-like domain-containing protein n=1 Tax=Halapricum sp. CBA1109 TaxID=2668068 RepID=UPI0018D265FF